LVPLSFSSDFLDVPMNFDLFWLWHQNDFRESLLESKVRLEMIVLASMIRRSH